MGPSKTTEKQSLISLVQIKQKFMELKKNRFAFMNSVLDRSMLVESLISVFLPSRNLKKTN